MEANGTSAATFFVCGPNCDTQRVALRFVCNGTTVTATSPAFCWSFPVSDVYAVVLSKPDSTDLHLVSDVDATFIADNHAPVPLRAVYNASFDCPLKRRTRVLVTLYSSLTKSVDANAIDIQQRKFLDYLSKLINSTDEEDNRAGPIYLFANPKAGQNETLEILRRVIVPMLELSGFLIIEDGDQAGKAFDEHLGQDGEAFKSSQRTIIISKTSRQRYAFEYARDVLLREQKTEITFLCASGDGLVHEVVNGCMEAVTIMKETNTPKGLTHRRPFRVGVIPCGSGNALATSLQVLSPEEAMLRFITGKRTNMNIARGDIVVPDAVVGNERVSGMDREPTVNAHQQATGSENISVRSPFYICCVFSYGFHAKVVADSEWLRPYLGPKRFMVSAAMNLVLKKSYETVLKVIQPAFEYVPEHLRTSSHPPGAHPVVSNPDIRDSFFFRPEGENFIPSTKTSLSGDFSYFLASKVSCLEPSYPAAPFGSPSSPFLDIVLAKNLTRHQLAHFCSTAIKRSSHLDEGDLNVTYIKAKGISLEPDWNCNRIGEYDICVDGEIYRLERDERAVLKMLEPNEQFFEILL